MTPAAIIDWLRSQGVELAIGDKVGGKYVVALQDGRHNLDAFDSLIKRIRAKESELLIYLKNTGDKDASVPQ